MNSPYPLLARTALVVVDMQNDCCHPDGVLAGIGVAIGGFRATVPVLARLIPLLCEHDAPIVWVAWGNRHDRANLSPGVRHVYDPGGMGMGSLNNPAGSPVLESGSWAAAVGRISPDSCAPATLDNVRQCFGFTTTSQAMARGLHEATTKEREQ